MVNALNVLFVCLTDTSRHPDRCEEHVRAGNLTYEVEHFFSSLQRRNYLLCNTVAAGVMNSDIQARDQS